MIVRPYEARDREDVRAVCHLTGFMGEPVDWLWRDRESFADMFSGYYTDAEPRSAFVVDIDGTACGYLLGCVDSDKAWDVGRVVARHVVRRGIALRPGTAGVVWRSVADLVRDRPRIAEFEDPAYPAHLHIDLLPQARGQGAGRRLMKLWLDRLRELGVSGCHLGTFAENSGAIAFFEGVGFERHGAPMPVPGFRTRDGARMHEQIMVRSL